MSDPSNMVVHSTPISYRSMLDKVKIEIIDLHKTLGDHKVLNGVSLDIKEGETMCIIGCSGGTCESQISSELPDISPDLHNVVDESLAGHGNGDLGVGILAFLGDDQSQFSH